MTPFALVVSLAVAQVLKTSTPPEAAPKMVIVPKSWWVLPRGDALDVERELARCVLAPESVTPFASTPQSNSRWVRCEGELPPDVALACTTLTSDGDVVRMARLIGAETLYVNGSGFHGDPERRGFGGVPIALRSGANRMVIAGIRDRFTLELEDPITPLRIATWDPAWPGFIDDEDDYYDVSYPVFDATTSPVRFLHVHYGHATPEGGDCVPKANDWRDGAPLAPLSMHMGKSYWDDLFGEVKCTPPSHCEFVVARVYVFEDDDGNGSDESRADRQLIRRSTVKSDVEMYPWSNRNPLVADRGLLDRTGTKLVLVYGTQGSPEEVEARLSRARLDQQRMWYRYRLVPPIFSDEQWCIAAGWEPGAERERERLSWYVRERSVVLYGNAASNSAWKKTLGDGAPARVEAGRAKLGELQHEGDDGFGWFTFHADELGRVEKKYFDVALFDTGLPGARAASLVDVWRGDVPSGDHELLRADLDARGGLRRLVRAPK